MPKRRRKLRLKFTFREFRASLRLAKKTTLIRIVATLFPSASVTAKNKAMKMMAGSIRRAGRKVKRRVKRRTAGTRRRSRKTGRRKGRTAAQRRATRKLVSLNRSRRRIRLIRRRSQRHRRRSLVNSNCNRRTISSIPRTIRSLENNHMRSISQRA